MDLIGQIVDAESLVPLQGVAIHIALSNGTSLDATSDAHGDWEVVGPPLTTDTVSATALVTAPGHPGYTVPTFPITPMVRKGDATLLGAWYSHPYVRYIVILTYNDNALVGATVTFQPTAGASVTGTLTSTTNGIGAFTLDLGSEQLSPVVGVLTVTHPNLAQPSVFHGYTIPLEFKAGIPAPRTAYAVGGLFAYGGLVYSRATGKPLSGVLVKWVRHSGIQVTPTTLTARTGDDGFFLLAAKPARYGTATGVLTFTPPNEPVTTLSGVQMSVYDSTAYRFLDIFTVAP